MLLINNTRHGSNMGKPTRKPKRTILDIRRKPTDRTSPINSRTSLAISHSNITLQSRTRRNNTIRNQLQAT